MKKMQGLTKVSRRAMAAVLALVLALIFSSCENMSDNGPASFLLPLVQTTQTAGQASSQKATIIVRGTVGVGGALPDEVSAKVSALNASIAAQGVSKSAQPELKIGKAEGDDYYYYVTATQQDGERKIVSYGRDDNGAGGAFVGGTNGVSYALPLTEGQWIIECGIKNLENKPVLRATSGLINLTPTDSIVTKIFPDMVISMIEVGEETGKLPDMLEKIADTYDEEVDNAVSALTSMIEPLMIVFLAVIVGGIVIALFAPLITIIQTLGGG